MRRRSAAAWWFTGLATLSLLTSAPPAIAAPRPHFAACRARDVVASQVTPKSGLHLTAPVLGGQLTLTATPKAIVPGTRVRICTTRPGGPAPTNGNALIAAFGIEVDAAGVAGARGPLHVTLRGRALRPSSFVEVVTPGAQLPPRLEAASGQMQFDTNQYVGYRVLAPTGESAGRGSPLPTTQHSHSWQLAIAIGLLALVGISSLLFVGYWRRRGAPRGERAVR